MSAACLAHHRDRLQLYLRARLANPDDAAELAQEAYLRMPRVKRADLIRHPASLPLSHCAQPGACDLHGTSNEADIDVDILESEDPSSYDLAVLAGRRELVERAMQELAAK